MPEVDSNPIFTIVGAPKEKPVLARNGKRVEYLNAVETCSYIVSIISEFAQHPNQPPWGPKNTLNMEIPLTSYIYTCDLKPSSFSVI